MLTRRAFLTEVTAIGGIVAASPRVVRSQSSDRPSSIPIIDTHIHLFDPTRPQGAPYSGPPGVPVQPSLPPRYRKLAAPLGIVGAIKIEASPWVEDNLWVLEVAERDPIIVGVVGNLEPDKPDFGRCSARYHKNPLFRGIRYGNLWGRDITKQADNPAFIERTEAAAAGRSRSRYGEPARGSAASDRADHRQGSRPSRGARSPAESGSDTARRNKAYDDALRQTSAAAAACSSSCPPSSIA